MLCVQCISEEGLKQYIRAFVVFHFKLNKKIKTPSVKTKGVEAT